MKKHLKVTLLADEPALPLDDAGKEGYHEEQNTEYQVYRALKDCGHEVEIVPVYDDVVDFIGRVRHQRPDVIFNLTEQFRNNRWLDKSVAGLLELLDIPFTGSGTAGLLLCRNKAICKQILSTRKIRVPAFQIFEPHKKPRLARSLRYPVVIKPLNEDGSDGIANASLVNNANELTARIELIHTTWKQPAIAEEYIDGRELYVSIIGNTRCRVLPPRELFFAGKRAGGPVMATSRVKWNKRYRRKWGIRFGNASLLEKDHKRIRRTCLKAYRLLKLGDYGRIDLRLDSAGKLCVIEANPNPDLSFDDEFAMSARAGRIDYPALIDTILRLAITRHSRR